MVSEEGGESNINCRFSSVKVYPGHVYPRDQTLIMAPTAPSNSKQKKGQNPSGGVGKERPKEKKDAKALFDEAKAQEREIQEQQDPDAMLTEKRERDQAKADKVAGGLFVQDDGQTQETVSPFVVSVAPY